MSSWLVTFILVSATKCFSATTNRLSQNSVTTQTRSKLNYEPNRTNSTEAGRRIAAACNTQSKIVVTWQSMCHSGHASHLKQKWDEKSFQEEAEATDLPQRELKTASVWVRNEGSTERWAAVHHHGCHCCKWDESIETLANLNGSTCLPINPLPARSIDPDGARTRDTTSIWKA